MTVTVNSQKSDVLLALTHLVRQVSGKTRMQKLAFLLQKESGIDRFQNLFSFEPYYYGPYSEELARLMTSLAQEGLLEADQYHYGSNGEERVTNSYSVSAKGRARAVQFLESLPPQERAQLSSLAARYQFEPLPKILEHVYSRYPEMAINSQWTGRRT